VASFLEHQNKNRVDYGYGDETIRMIILLRCSESNLPKDIRTSFLFGRVVEHMVSSFAQSFVSLVACAKPGGACEDPNASLLATIMPILLKFIDGLVDKVLKNPQFVTLVGFKNCQDYYECGKCFSIWKTIDESQKCANSHRDLFECSLCNEGFETKKLRDDHYTGLTHMTKKLEQDNIKRIAAGVEPWPHPYPCLMCNEFFETKTLRDLHYMGLPHMTKKLEQDNIKRIAAGIEPWPRPYPCLTCNEFFETEKLRDDHYVGLTHMTKKLEQDNIKRIAAGIEPWPHPYLCLTCNEFFETASLRSSHYKKKYHKEALEKKCQEKEAES